MGVDGDGWRGAVGGGGVATRWEGAVGGVVATRWEGEGEDGEGD